MSNTPSEQSRREAHDNVAGKKEAIYRLIISSIENGGANNPLALSKKTGIPVTSLRPRFTELADYKYCREKLGKRPVLKQIGRVMVEGARCMVTAYGMNTRRVNDVWARCSNCDGWGTMSDGGPCYACCGGGNKPPCGGLGGRDGLD